MASKVVYMLFMNKEKPALVAGVGYGLAFSTGTELGH